MAPMTHRERVLATVHNIQEQVQPENIVAMFEACLSNRN